MALTLERILDVKRRTRMDSRKPGITETLRALWKHMEQVGNIDLQFVPLDYFPRADQVIADVACRLYALMYVVPTAGTTAQWIKASNHATVAAAAGDLVIAIMATTGAGAAACVVWPDGLKFDTGITTASHTSLAGSTDTATGDAPQGFAIVGPY
jgi:hypothetical protein